MTLQIEEGKYYENEQGHKLGPARPSANRDYPWQLYNHTLRRYATYATDGRAVIGISTPYNLLREIPVPDDTADESRQEVDAAPTLQIEEGKYYRDRNGVVQGPATRVDTTGAHKWLVWDKKVSRNFLFIDNGRFVASMDTPFDLVEEVHAPDAVETAAPTDDPTNPAHYRSHPSGVECIQITEHMNFCRGNAIKYIWRADEKGNPIENLEKAIWYLNREISRIRKIDS